MSASPRPSRTRNYREFVMESSRWDGFEFGDDV
jgi:hypothetical protein